MNEGVQITYLWHDSDVIELRIAIENEAFRGSTDIYAAPGEIFDNVAILQGFPNGPRDQRTVSFGAFGKNFAGGAVKFDFYCKNASGHSAFRAMVEANYQNLTQAEAATIFADFDPAMLDQFLIELHEIARGCQGSAVLKIG